jgi:N-carbamoylputrescine amidase
MQGHSAANVIPVAAANRVGEERVTPSAENGGQKSALVFYGSSFLTDETGEIIAGADRESECVLLTKYDFDRIRQERRNWNVFRDRRPETYGILTR